ncbi:MAG: glycine cleavage system protein H [Thermoprotei archaeon]|nr:MAG: glycine cleavage system protein H [Thermoprotei archaeon]
MIVARIDGFLIPEDLRYDVENHVWVKELDDGTVLVGLDDVGQHLARRIVFVKPQPPGTYVRKGEAVAMLESVKWVGPLPSPVNATIVEINEEVVRRPVLINRNPYNAWIARLRPDDLAEVRRLPTGEDALRLQLEDIRRRGVKKG